MDEYCVKSRPSRSETEDVTDFYDDDYADDLDDDDEEEDCMEYSEDSGNEETWYFYVNVACNFVTVYILYCETFSWRKALEQLNWL